MSGNQAFETDTIAAPATGAGESAVAIVKLSGPRALDIFGAMFVPSGGRPARLLPDRRLTLGQILDASGCAIDDGLGVVMRAPHSFTGEDTAECHCHGGRAVVLSVLDSCFTLGARPARPGEFTRRAFLNNRIDLSQAEAIADLVAARTSLSRKLALRQLRGGLSERIAALRGRLLDAAAQIEAQLDFPDEELPPLARQHIITHFHETETEIARMLAGFERGRHARDGARVVIAGPPNAGKSSLFNALVGRERAIVTPHPGTTRDTIESTIEAGGIPVTLVDTAGIRSASDNIEHIGIERAKEEIGQADIVLLVLDASDPSAPAPALTEADSHVIVLLNKSDLISSTAPSVQLTPEHAIRVSAVTRAGLEEVERRLAESLVGCAGEDELMVANARHAQCLRGALQSLACARSAFERDMPEELVMVDVRGAIHRLGDIIGIGLEDDILDRIFNIFCIGK